MKVNKTLTALACLAIVACMQSSCKNVEYHMNFSGDVNSSVHVEGNSKTIYQHGNGNIFFSSSNTILSQLVHINGLLIQLRGSRVAVSGDGIEVDGKQVDPATVVTRSGVDAGRNFSAGAFNKIDVPGHLATVKQSPFSNSCLVCDSNFLDYVRAYNNNGTLKAELTEDNKPFKTSGRPLCTLYTPLQDHEQLDIIGSSRVEFGDVQRDTFDLSVRGAAKVQAQSIETQTLKVDLAGASSLSTGEISTGHLQADLSGSAQVQAQDIKANSLEVKSGGASRLSAKKLLAGFLRANLNGSSNVNIEGGAVDNQEVATSGSSCYNSAHLKSIICRVGMSGASSAIVNVLQKLHGKISGATRLFYHGNPAENSVRKSGCASVNNIGN